MRGTGGGSCSSAAAPARSPGPRVTETMSVSKTGNSRRIGRKLNGHTVRKQTYLFAQRLGLPKTATYLSTIRSSPLILRSFEPNTAPERVLLSQICLYFRRCNRCYETNLSFEARVWGINGA